DDRDGYTVPGRVLPRLADVEQGEARRGDRHIRFGHGDGPRADVALPHRRFRPGLAVRRNPAGINDGWRNRLCCRQTRRHSDQQADESEGGDPQRRQRTHHRMRTQLNSPPIHAASGNAAMIAAISSHSATIRTNGVNLVIGTSRAATKPAAPNPASSSAPHTATGSARLAPTQIPVNTLLARTAAAAICAPRGVVSGLISSSMASSTGDTASTGRPALRRKRSRPVTEPKYGGRILADHSAIVGDSVSKNSRMTSVHIPSHWAGTGRHIRTAAMTPPSAH